MKGRWLLLAATIALVGVLVYPLIGTPPTVELDPLHTADSTSLLGYRGLIEALGANDVPVRYRRSPRLTDDDAMLWIMAEPLAATFTEQLEAVLEHAPAYLMIVLPKWRSTMDDRGWADNIQRVAPHEVTDILTELGWTMSPTDLPVTRFDAMPTPAPERAAPLLQAVPMDDQLELWIGDDTYSLVSSYEYKEHDTTVILVSDPDLLNNRGFHQQTATHLVDALTDLAIEDTLTVVFDDHIHGYGQSRPFWHAVGQFPLVLLLLHALVMIGLLLWTFAGTRQLPAAPAPAAAGAQQLVTTTASLLTAPQHRDALIAEYLSVCRSEATRGQPLSDAQIEKLEHIQRTTTTMAQLQAARPGAAKHAATTQRLLTAAYQWRHEMTRQTTAHAAEL